MKLWARSLAVGRCPYEAESQVQFLAGPIFLIFLVIKKYDAIPINETIKNIFEISIAEKRK